MEMEAEKLVKWLLFYPKFNSATWILLFSLMETTLVSQLLSWFFGYNKLLVTYLLPIVNVYQTRHLSLVTTVNIKQNNFNVLHRKNT